jgi:hypothetical protein
MHMIFQQIYACKYIFIKWNMQNFKFYTFMTFLLLVYWALLLITWNNDRYRDT